MSSSPGAAAAAAAAAAAKVVFVGDEGAGKTSLIAAYLGLPFTDQHYPTLCETYESADKALELCDTAGAPELDRLRPLSYDGADLFVIVFSMNSLFLWFQASQARKKALRKGWIKEDELEIPDFGSEGDYVETVKSYLDGVMAAGEIAKDPRIIEELVRKLQEARGFSIDAGVAVKGINIEAQTVGFRLLDKNNQGVYLTIIEPNCKKGYGRGFIRYVENQNLLSNKIEFIFIVGTDKNLGFYEKLGYYVLTFKQRDSGMDALLVESPMQIAYIKMSVLPHRVHEH
ncbi:hypothetical protein DFS34DRAFT_59770 [Phlyctochytrium arcticum]|nr:hypothetical protein DFS34DRAFT_59770 [Phlyctochytrium arcticum]